MVEFYSEPQPQSTMPVLAATTKLTVKEFLALPECEERIELVDGKIIVSPKPKSNHLDTPARKLPFASMFDRPLAGEDHGDLRVGFVACANDFVVVDGTARMAHGDYSCVDPHIHTVTEWEEGI